MAHAKRATFTSSWSDLPNDILSDIERRLDNAVDISQLRSVCKAWHASRNPNNISILSPFLPRNISNAGLPFTDRPNALVTFIARAVFLVKPLQSSPSTPGWFLTVEEIVPGKLQILYPLSTNQVKLPSNFPKYLDLSKFSMLEVAKNYGIKYASDYTDVCGVQKVVVCAGSTPTAMVLFGKGTLIGVRLKNGDWGYVRTSLICFINDVINFKGMIYAVDCYLNVLVNDYKTMSITHITKCGSSSRSDSNMRLVEWDTEFHLVKWCSTPNGGGLDFKTWRMDEIQKKWDPRNCLNLCNIFVSLGWCFLAQIPGINGDYILCSRNCYGFIDFYRRNNLGKHQLFEDASMAIGIDVYFRNTGNISTDSSQLADCLWPPPLWLLPEKYTCSRDDENDQVLNIDNPDMLFGANLLPPYTAVTASGNGIITDKQAFGAQTSGKNIHISHARTIQNVNQNHPTVVYNGANVKSNLVPTLEKVWAKYGNILEGCKIRNADVIGMFVE